MSPKKSRTRTRDSEPGNVKPDTENNAGDEEGTILSLSSLREAFERVESDDESGFDWVGDAPSKKKRKTRTDAGEASSTPNLAIYSEDESDEDDEEPEDIESEFDGSDLGDFDEEDGEESIAPTEDEESRPIELSPLSILEAMLFVGDKEGRPLTPERASDFMRNVSPEEITKLVETLNRRYSALNCPYEILAEDRGFRLSLKEDFESVRTRFYGRIKEARLNQSAIDVLSIVAYRQPITAEEVQKIRKQPSLPILSQLVRRDLLCLEREIQDKRRITFYRTTERFLRLFELESLDELPTAEELEEKL